MRTNVVKLLVVLWLLATAGCGRTGPRVRPDPPRGTLPPLAKEIKPSLGAEQWLSDEFLEKPVSGTPTTSGSTTP